MLALSSRVHGSLISEHSLIVFRDVDGTQRPMRYEWFSLGFFDAATFHIILANSAAHIDLLHGHPLGERSLEAERYHLLALESINKRLAQPTPDVTDSLISAVTGFIVHNVASPALYYVFNH